MFDLILVLRSVAATPIAHTRYHHHSHA